MSIPNMATLTASLERSLQNCSINHRSSSHRGGATTGFGRSSSSSSSDAPEISQNHLRDREQQYQQQQQFPSSFPASNVTDNYSNNFLSSSASSTTSNDSTLIELNSHISLPNHWEQCLDLKTGEVYYINWKSGMKAKEDPRRTTATGNYSGAINNYSSDDDSYDSDGSSTAESSPSSTSRENFRIPRIVVDDNEDQAVNAAGGNDVLVVAGCKRCLMYYMVPKRVEDCLKCNGQLLHFDGSDTTTISSTSP